MYLYVYGFSSVFQGGKSFPFPSEYYVNKCIKYLDAQRLG